MEELDKRIKKIINKLNTIENINDLEIPILDNFKVLKSEIDSESNVIFVASNGNTIEQFLTEGTVDETVKLENKIKEIIATINKQVKNNPLYKNRNYIKKYKTYNNGTFDFMIYIQDIITGTSTNTSFIRQLNAYFIEPEGREFCQVSLSAGRYRVSEEYKLINDINKLEEDKIIIELDKSLTKILDNLKYKNK